MTSWRNRRRRPNAAQKDRPFGYHMLMVECFEDGRLLVSLDNGDFGRRAKSAECFVPSTGRTPVDPFTAAKQVELVSATREVELRKSKKGAPLDD